MNSYTELVNANPGTSQPASYSGPLVASGGGLSAPLTNSSSQPGTGDTLSFAGNPTRLCKSPEPGTLPFPWPTAWKCPGDSVDFNLGVPGVSDIPGASGVQSAANAVSSTADFLSWLKGHLADKAFWKSLGLVALAVPLAILGIILWTGKGKDVIKLSTKAAEAGAEAGAAA